MRLSHAASVIVVASRDIETQQADARTILTLFTLGSFLERTGATKRRKAPLHVVAEILDAENVAHARAAGADEVIETTRLGFSMLAHALIVPGSATIMSRMADAPAHSLFVDPISESIETPAPFEEVRRRVKAEHGAMVIDFRRPGRRDDQINPSDDVIVPPRQPARLHCRRPRPRVRVLPCHDRLISWSGRVAVASAVFHIKLSD